MPAIQQLTGGLWGVGLGAALILIIVVVVNDAWWRRGAGAPEGGFPDPTPPVDEFVEDVAEAHGRTTMFVKLYALAFVLWAIGYVVIFLTTKHPS